MQNWLLSNIEPQGERGQASADAVTIDVNTSPATLLGRADVAQCLEHGVAVAIGATPLGHISGARLRRLLADLYQRTERRANDAARAADRYRRHRQVLAANLSHELRTPLCAISGYSELVALGLENGRTVSAAQQNEVIWEAAQSLLGTIDSMLDVAGIEAGQATLEESEIDVAAACKSVSRMLVTMASARRVRVDIDVKPDMPQLYADSRILRQILVNLVSNAIKYGACGGEVKMIARVDRRGRLRIEVRDRGEGMAAEAIEAAMRPFARLDAVGEDATPGTGLGLPMVKALTELHEGDFRLLSTPGKGTRAIVTMPAGRVLKVERGQQQAFVFQRAASDFLG